MNLKSSKNLSKLVELHNLALKKTIQKNEKNLFNAINLIYKTLQKKKNVFICGNGGSAAEAQHLSTEFLIRLNPKINRKSLPLINLCMDQANITACGNDFGFKYIFSRNLEALAKTGDVLICLTTSGKSSNIIEVLKKSKKMKIASIVFLGDKKNLIKNFANIYINVQSNNVAVIQEVHLFLGHYILNEVEQKILKKK
mgnify:CR=1 FL=1